MRNQFVAIALSYFAIFPPSSGICEERSPASASGPCSAEEAAPSKIVAIEEDLTLLTDEGRRIVLAGLEFPSNGELRERSRARLSALVVDEPLVFLSVGASAPDRWGRSAARLFVLGEGTEASLESVGESMLRSGMARARPDAAAIACRNAFLAAERHARDQRLGVWASGDYVVIDAARREAFLDRKGMVLVEGVVSGTGEAGGSLYLNFGPRRGVDFAVVIWKRNLEAFDRAGLRPRMLGGRRVRVRGLLDTSFGPRMEIATPAEIEVLDAAR